MQQQTTTAAPVLTWPEGQPPPWDGRTDWPETIEAVGVSSFLGQRIQAVRNIRDMAREKRLEAMRLSKQAETLEAFIATATLSTDWHDLARATVLLPVYRRTIDQLQADAEPLEVKAAALWPAIEATWSEYHALFLRWQKKPSDDLAAQLASFCWPTR